MKSIDVSEEEVLIAIFESGLHQYNPAVLSVRWKDGIDVNIPSRSIMNFAQKLVDRITQKVKNENP